MTEQTVFTDAFSALNSLAETQLHCAEVTPPKQASRWLPWVHIAIANLTLDGDATALKICLERVCPPMRPRDESVRLDMPQGDSLASLGRRILEGMGKVA
jgi:hypothetical protein